MKHKQIVHFVTLALLTAIVVVLQLLGGGITLGSFSITLVLIPVVVGAAIYGAADGAFLGAVFGVITFINCARGADPYGNILFTANPFLCALVCIAKGAAAGFFAAMIYRLLDKLVRKMTHKNIAVAVSALFSGLFAALCMIGCMYLFPFEKKYLFLSLLPSLPIGIGLGILLGRLYLRFTQNKKELADSYISVFGAAIIAPIANTSVFCVGMLLFFRETLSAWAGSTATLEYIIFGLAGVNFLLELAINLICAPAIATIIKAVQKTKK